MKSLLCFLASALVPITLPAALPSPAATAAPIDFVRDVRPILQKHCYRCHGEQKQKSGLRLDIKSEALKGGEAYGPSVIAGDAASSPLVQFVSGDGAELQMPPEGKRLSKTEIATLTAWVQEGAVWPDGVDLAKLEDKRDHWSFQPVRRPRVPTTPANAWPRNEIDQFIAARLEQAGLQPAREADRLTWLRRVYFDLIGLPPAPAEVDAFLADERIDAYARVADKLLNSPRYGERWAQHWLDVVRYADTDGFEVNTPRPNAWPYRDYVIAAFNNDTSYDRFIQEQLAGDAYQQDAATGFLVTAAALLPGQIGQDDASKRLARQDSLAEILINTGEAFLGLSIGCARCHDHKVDPISQRDYYSMQAFFSGVQYADRPIRSPEAEARVQKAESLRARLAEIDARLARDEKPGSADGDRPAPEQLVAEKKKLEARIAATEEGVMVFAGKFTEPETTRLLFRGDSEQPRETLQPAVIEALGSLRMPEDAAEQERRLALADWIASPENPLTALVGVNRIWQWHFGLGLVETASDFGRSGARPTHPELLDWLADEFVRSGWSIKRMHRLIVLSATYRQSNRIDPAAQAKDAAARLLWRFPSRRLEAEAIRDTMLQVSGRLNLKMGGPGFDLFEARGGLSGFPPIEVFGDEGLRRMVYAHRIRMEREIVFGAFDCPDAGQSTARRRQSTTPIQALNLFNSRFTIDQADAFAARVSAEAGGETAAQIRRAYQLAFGREANADEVGEAEPVLREHGLPALCRVLFNSNEFLFIP